MSNATGVRRPIRPRIRTGPIAQGIETGSVRFALRPRFALLTVRLSGGRYISHDADLSREEPGGMNVAYGDGSAGWYNWNECDLYYNSGHSYYWSEMSN